MDDLGEMLLVWIGLASASVLITLLALWVLA